MIALLQGNTANPAANPPPSPNAASQRPGEAA